MTERADTPTAGDDLPRFTRALRPLVDMAARLPASVHTKLLGGYLVGVLLLLTMGAVSLLVIERMSQQAHQLTEVYTKDTLVYRLEHQITLQSHLRAMAILTQQQSYNDGIAASKARFSRELAAVEALSPPDQVAVIQRVREADQRFAAASDRVLALYRAGDLDGATRLHLDQEHPISHEIEAAMQQLEAENDDEAERAIRQFDVDRGILTALLGAFSSVSLATALLLGFVLSWALTRPVRRIDRTLAHITAGQFGRQIEVLNGDELGTLSRNLNLMSRELERLYAELNGLNESLQEKNEQLGLELAERRRAEAELAVARDQALEANRVKTSFLTNVSAELRTPLNTILGFTESLIEDAEAAGQESAIADLQHIRAAAVHLLRILNDILDLSAIEAGRMELYLEPVSVGEVVADVVAILRPLAQNGGNTLQVDCAADVGIIDADLTRVRQILFNLLNNACKFTQRGSIAVRVARETEDDAHWVTVAVSDTGAGIPPEQLQGLFDSFGQAGDAATRGQTGPGLGLAMTHRLCQLMGAELTVQSEYGRGSTFTVRLPATAPAAVGAAAIHLASGTSAPDVLVIDDDPVVRERIHDLLADEGLVAKGAARAEEGVRLAVDQRPRAITLDLLMPGGEGWGALAALKSNPALVDVPIVMLTLFADRAAGLLLDVADFLTTPFDPARVAAVSGQRPDRPGPPHALVVDADPAAREALRQALESDGWTVTTAASGSRALAALETVAVDRVFVHLAMAEMSGLELVHRLRREPRWQSIPVVGIIAAEPTVQERLRLNKSVAVLFKEDVLDEAELLSRLGDRLSAAIGVARDGAGSLAGSLEASPALAGAPPPRRVSGRILIVDDNAVNRTELAVQLEQSGHTTAQVANGREALEALGSGNVDLVLCDVTMPEMDGYELLERRMADPRLGAVPVIMVAPANDVRDVARCIELGAEDFLTRPLDPVLLRARVSTCLEKKWLRDQEVEYLQQVGRVTAAAAAVETGTFDAESIVDLGKREDALGRLVRVFQHMVQEVYAREQRLREQVRELRIEIDQTKRARQVAEITETDYFRQLQQRAQSMRRRAGAPAT